jgi:hypothetical protein
LSAASIKKSNATPSPCLSLAGLENIPEANPLRGADVDLVNVLKGEPETPSTGLVAAASF